MTKRKIFKQPENKRHIKHRGTKMRKTPNPSVETMQAEDRYDMFKVLTEKLSTQNSMHWKNIFQTRRQDNKFSIQTKTKTLHCP